MDTIIVIQVKWIFTKYHIGDSTTQISYWRFYKIDTNVRKSIV